MGGIRRHVRGVAVVSHVNFHPEAVTQGDEAIEGAIVAHRPRRNHGEQDASRQHARPATMRVPPAIAAPPARSRERAAARAARDSPARPHPHRIPTPANRAARGSSPAAAFAATARWRSGKSTRRNKFVRRPDKSSTGKNAHAHPRPARFAHRAPASPESKPESPSAKRIGC